MVLYYIRLYNEHVPDAKKDIAVDNATFKLVKEYNGRACAI